MTMLRENWSNPDNWEHWRYRAVCDNVLITALFILLVLYLLEIGVFAHIPLLIRPGVIVAFIAVNAVAIVIMYFVIGLAIKSFYYWITGRGNELFF